MLEVARRWTRSPLFPQIQFTPMAAYLDAIAAELPEPLPQWQDELYLEFHRGCYTSHADQKLANRRCEQLLYQAELFASLASWVASASYPQSALEQAWKQVDYIFCFFPVKIFHSAKAGNRRQQEKQLIIRVSLE